MTWKVFFLIIVEFYSNRKCKYQNHEASALIGKVCRLEIRELRTKCCKPLGGSAPKPNTECILKWQQYSNMLWSLCVLQIQYQILMADLKNILERTLGSLRTRYTTTMVWINFLPFYFSQKILKNISQCIIRNIMKNVS